MALVGERVFSAPSKRSDLEGLPQSQRYSVGPAEDADLPELARMLAAQIPDLKATYEAFEQVHRQSRSILAVRTSNGLVGCFAALFLNHCGFERLIDGGLSIAEPSQFYLVGPGETAAALYIWAVCVPKMAVTATGNAFDWLKQDAYASADLYARPATPRGKTFMTRVGFHPLPDCDGKSLWVYRRQKDFWWGA